MKTILSRMCIVTHVKKPRNKLIKITRIKEEWILDDKQTLFGRSIYLDLNYINFKKFKKLQKKFKISDEDFQSIIIQLEEKLAKENI